MEGSLESPKFAEELHWCISQLELGLQHQSPDSRQAAESIKVLKILTSKKAPLVKKRQVMRNAFGDYRKKMKDAEKKSLSGLRRSRFQSLGLVTTPMASRFLKMSHNKQQNIDQVKSELNTTLNNLQLQFSQMEPGTSPKSVGFPSTLGSELAHQAYDGFDYPGSSVTACLGSTSTSASVQREKLTYTENIHSSSLGDKVPDLPASQNQAYVGNTSVSSHTGPSLLSNPTSNNSSSSSSVPASTSASHGKQGMDFKYEPSDNSFIFGFDNSEDGNREDHDGAIVTDAGAPGSVRTSPCDKNASRIYTYEKSENNFCFNFEVPQGEL